MRVLNCKNNQVLVTNLRIANTFFKRLKGLMGEKSLTEGEGLLIIPCNFIHTFFMRFPIGAVFLDNKDYVVKTMEIKPFRISPVVYKAIKVLELPGGVIRKGLVQEGDRLIFIED